MSCCGPLFRTSCCHSRWPSLTESSCSRLLYILLHLGASAICCLLLSRTVVEGVWGKAHGVSGQGLQSEEKKPVTSGLGTGSKCQPTSEKKLGPVHALWFTLPFLTTKCPADPDALGAVYPPIWQPGLSSAQWLWGCVSSVCGNRHFPPAAGPAAGRPALPHQPSRTAAQQVCVAVWMGMGQREVDTS